VDEPLRRSIGDDVLKGLSQRPKDLAQLPALEATLLARKRDT